MRLYKESDKWRITSNLEVREKLEVRNYLVGLDDFGYFLTEYPNFEELGEYKIFGGTDTKRYLNTFDKNEKSMGVWFTGLKGSGKSLHAKHLCFNSGLPTLIVSQPYAGSDFNAFLATLKQPVIVYIDEFEKVYSDLSIQEQLLPIFEGNLSTKILFLLTSNSREVSPFLQNRTGRIRYLIHFEGVKEEIVEEVLESKLENKANLQEVRSLMNLLTTVSMDNLLTIVDEMNVYDVGVREAILGLNIQFEHTEFDLIAFINGYRVQRKVYFNPLITSNISFSYEYHDNQRDRTQYGYYSRDTSELQLSVEGKEFKFTDNKNNELIFIPTSSDITNLFNYI